ncbi:GtrA family protein [Amycolatopsis halotolerans]|uniref:GtrA family protein n=1 Tax=Amycolatopsis halotolerans TaxID=330083 RepID=A0ABV7QM64_9PSEU
MPVFRKVLTLVPAFARPYVFRHRALLKFALVGGVCFLVTFVVNYGLKFTVLREKPVTAMIVATIVATIVSYVLNREWSFRSRRVRERRHEAALFFVLSGVGVALNSTPLYLSRYVLQLHVPVVSLVVQEAADFISSLIVGTLVAMVFRWWAFRKWVFPRESVEGDAAANPGPVHAIGQGRPLRPGLDVDGMPEGEERRSAG